MTGRGIVFLHIEQVCQTVPVAQLKTPRTSDTVNLTRELAALTFIFLFAYSRFP